MFLTLLSSVFFYWRQRFAHLFARILNLLSFIGRFILAAAMAAASDDTDKIEDYEFEELEDVAKMRLLRIYPAPNASETLNCELIQVPKRVYKSKDSVPRPRPYVDRGSQTEEAGNNQAEPDVDSTAQAETSQSDRQKLNEELKKLAELARHFTAERAKYDIVMEPYEALSYRWDPGDKSCCIFIHKNGRIYKFRISKHLHNALTVLRRKSDFRNLWVDTLCVNQEDDKERSKQVARMDEVYGEASNVCIWLGQEASRSTEALNFLRETALSIYEFDKRCADAQFVENWAAFLTLLKRDWFSRRWVVQEVSLAKRATVHCGDKCADWKDLADAVSLLNDIDLSAKKLSSAAKKLESLENPSDLFAEISALPATHLVQTANQMFKKSIVGHQRVGSLEQIVARLAMFESGEPRDYIYALLSLAKDSQPYASLPDHLDGRPLTPDDKKALQSVMRLLPNTYRERYVVDYEQPVVEVYQQFMKFALAKSDPALALDIICRPFAQPTPKEPLPSWIPVVSELPFAPQPNLKKGHFRMERLRGDPFVSMPDAFPQYSAAGRKPFKKDKVRFRQRGGNNSMFVEGFVLDTVVRVESASQMGNIPKEWVTLANDNLKRDKDKNKEPKDNKSEAKTKDEEAEDENREAFWTTLIADRGPRGGVPGIYGRAIKAALEVADNGLDITSYIREHESTIVSDALPHVQNTIWGRCLMETEDRRLGLGPKSLEKALHEKDIDEKDKRLLVCIIYGCTVPIILQECKKTDQSIEKETKEDEEDRIKREKDKEEIIKKWKERAVENREKRKRKKTTQTRPKSAKPSGEEEDDSPAPPPSVYYKVIGESYIYNMMHGEAIKWQNDKLNEGNENRVRTQIFELR